ncbi:MAG: SRPBCC family protein [Kangiellaceae bacterium]|nr:SRPBCC family protein [Kangiellaceae bacterium]
MKIISEITVQAPAERAWQVLAEQYGEAATWTSALESSMLTGKLGVGAIRTCHSKAVGPFPASVVDEQLIEFDSDKYQFTYIVERGLPGIFRSATNAWTIIPLESQSCKIRSHATLSASPWIFPIAWIFPIIIKRDLKYIFEEMAYYIERGEIHPRKVQANLEPLKE